MFRCSGIVILWLASLPGIASTWQVESDGVLGSSFSMTTVGLSEAQAETLSSVVLDEIERLENILSTWRDDSEIGALNQNGRADRISPELGEVLQLCEHWRERTDSAFSCRLGALLNAWRQATETDRLPDRSRMREQARAIEAADPELTDGAKFDGVVFEPSGLAKGYILDQALALARQHAPEADGLKIDIGGDGLYWGRNETGRPWQVAVGEPGVDNTDYLGLLALADQAVAFSGHNRRYMEIERRRLSHILDPKDGWPLSFAPSAVVVAPDATTADALATALTVMPIRHGLALVDDLSDVEALVMTEGGTAFASEEWYELLADDGIYDPAWGEGMRFVVEYRIPKHRVAQYRRPYVAVWITDEDRRLVRQLLLHGGESRWLRELPMWWRRHGRRDDTVVDGLARPTPEPGQHMLAWDGRDARGRAVEYGRYQLHIEVSREHGERELLVLPFEMNGEPFGARASGEKELDRVHLSFKNH